MMKLTGLLLVMGETTNMCKIFVGKPKECRPVWRPRHRWTVVEVEFSCGVHLCDSEHPLMGWCEPKAVMLVTNQGVFVGLLWSSVILSHTAWLQMVFSVV